MAAEDMANLDAVRQVVREEVRAAVSEIAKP
jgi:hypothetical protein